MNLKYIFIFLLCFLAGKDILCMERGTLSHLSDDELAARFEELVERSERNDIEVNHVLTDCETTVISHIRRDHNLTLSPDYSFQFKKGLWYLGGASVLTAAGLWGYFKMSSNNDYKPWVTYIGLGGGLVASCFSFKNFFNYCRNEGIITVQWNGRKKRKNPTTS